MIEFRVDRNSYLKKRTRNKKTKLNVFFCFLFVFFFGDAGRFVDDAVDVGVVVVGPAARGRPRRVGGEDQRQRADAALQQNGLGSRSAARQQPRVRPPARQAQGD